MPAFDSRAICDITVLKLWLRNITMDLRCMECANDLRNKVMVTRLGDFDVWYCDDCNVYYEKQDLYRMVYTA